MLHKIIIVILALVLTACGPMRKPTSYRLVPPSSAKGQRCLKNCHTIKMMCYKTCHDVDPVCNKQNKARAKEKFARYKTRQTENGLPVSKTWQNFYNARACKDKACGCKEDYNACFQMCGGQLIPVYN